MHDLLRRRRAFAATLTLLLTGVGIGAPARAHESGGHAGHAAPSRDASKVADTAFGRPGDPRKVTRSITVSMSDAMRFSPSTLTVARGETVRLNVVNQGKVLHELVLGTAEDLRQHAEMMRRHPGMQHDEPQMVHVQPGRRGEIVWQFTQAGEFSFACLIPGHFEAGMVGRVVVR
jgi:uncharacterized cupredoxin-like copper-binding protein